MPEARQPNGAAPPAAEGHVAVIDLADHSEALQLFGRGDQNLRLIQDSFPVQIVSRGDHIRLRGRPDEVRQVATLFEGLLQQVRRGVPLGPEDVRYAIQLAREGRAERIPEVGDDVIVTTARGKPIRPKTLGQRRYVEAIRENGIVFGIGPAGTGKTYLAMAVAIASLKAHQVARIILTRPAVEAGEKLGFLPGDLQEKVDPYLRPLYDALWDMLGVETFQKYMNRGLIEVAPLAYMRGRTLDDSFIILDEAQNTTPEQMKMFLTRLGFGSKAVVTGDVTQVDLPRGRHSGLAHVQQVLKDIEGIEFVYLTERDVVRHPLVQQIILAYEAYERQEEQAAAGRDGGAREGSPEGQEGRDAGAGRRERDGSGAGGAGRRRP
ncbi:PhoH family protein [Thermaerobacter litoralis]